MFKDISEIMSQEFDGKEVEIRGWIWRTRSSGKIVFATIRDPSGVIQVTVKKGNLPEEQFDDAVKALLESSVAVTGTLKADDRAPGGFEVQVTGFDVVGFADAYPIQKDQSEEWLRENRHLWIRSRRMSAIMKVRSTMTGAIHEFFRKEGYYEFTPPIFTPNACEGGATLFEVKYYDKKVYLTQTWQLYAEAMIFSLGKIYDMSPTFRSEKSKTSRHLTEFWMAEMEAAWLTYHDVIQVAKDEIKFIIRKILDTNAAELEFLEVDTEMLEAMIKKEWPTITYTEALKILKEKDDMDVVWGKDLRTIEEEAIMKHFDTPVAVVEYPKEAMAFYKPVKEDADAPGPVAKCFDMLAPDCGLEIVGGSERDTDINALIKALEEEGEPVDNYDWYLDLRRYGSVVHSGYGLGVERVLQWILGLDNIKDAIPFPRTMGRVRP
ncbi:MAG: asparagine--tRNA ligase [Thermoplasmata archaeon]|nr:asparagine--tRNA ligase [Thermoplasmata archaeon]MCK5397628.1 asparagine--tRNA ligase [Thermoplasmata archaeon]